jgi:putative tRNA adenosine deaminase-associated protein
MAGTDDVDFAVAAYREEGAWQVAELTHDHVADVETLAEALRRFPGDHGSIGMVAVDEDYFLIVHVIGQHAQVMLSDITAATESELAASAVEYLGLPLPDDEEEQEPAGELDLLEDLGLTAMDLGMLLDDPDYYPDELLSEVARRVGFGEAFDETVGLTSA